MNEHIASVHRGDCSVCETEFSSKSNMTSHIAKLHIEKKGLQMSTLSISVCQLKSSKSSLCKCSICDKEASQNGHLNEYIGRVHEEKRPNKCSVCDKVFSRESKLNEHIASVHRGDCSVCEKEFTRKSNTTSHIAKLHIEKKRLANVHFVNKCLPVKIF